MIDSIELAATEPRRQIDSPFLVTRGETKFAAQVQWTLNNQGSILNAQLATNDPQTITAISDFIQTHNAAAREKAALSK